VRDGSRIGYHVAPPDSRESIDAEGLKAQRPLEPGGPRGVYLWESEARAREETPEGHDIYEVEFPRPYAYPDPNPAVHGATVYPGDVPPPQGSSAHLVATPRPRD
jgi:hypothetical protein